MNHNLNRIGFTGPFADVNFGDYGMLINNIYDMKVKNITLFSYDSEFLSKIKADYLSNYDVRIVDVALSDDIAQIKKKDYIATPVELLNCIKNYEDLLYEIENIDVLAVNGGGYFNSLWSLPHRIERLIKIISPILIANQIGKKIVFTGNGFGPFGEDAEFFACIFNALDNVIFCCRDNLYSPMWLRQLGVDSSKISFVPDDLYLINPQLVELDSDVNLNAKDYIVMECYMPLDFFKSNIQRFIDFSEKIYQRYGFHIVFLPFHLAHGGMDQAEYLGTQLNHFEFYDIAAKGYLPIQDAVKIIKDAKLVLCNRYHALILALSCGIPVINVLKDVINDKRYYYNKSYGMLREAFRNIGIDQRLYIKTDYLEALDWISNHMKEILTAQHQNYNLQYRLNKEQLFTIRREHLHRILEP